MTHSARNLYLILPAISLFLAACGGGGGKDRDSAAAADSQRAAEAAAMPDTLPTFYLTAEGLGPVKVGMAVNSLPEKVEGLYTGRSAEQGFDSSAYVFSNADAPESDTYPFTVLDFGSDRVDVILLNDDQCAVAVPGAADITLSSPFTAVLALPGVKAEWETVEGSGAWYWTWEGLWFQPSLDNPGDEAARKMYNGASAPVASDFGQSVTIGYIATGLPF
ncbi:MAG: hypothetical protein K2O24_05325 [Muribaculaceae bacterium]|nr:hypothetical protein [Muribaculaceae bacterium]